MRRLFLFLCLCFRASPSEPVGKALADFRARAGVVFAECADKKCLEAAQPTCTPSHFEHRFSTIEGTQAIIDYFVLKQAEGCRVVIFADYTQDALGGCAFVKRTRTAVDDGDCSAPVTLFEERDCRT